MKYPFVSVVIATYNRKNELKECLDSLFSQRYPKNRYEIVVINDGSSDGTEDTLRACERMAPCRFKWFNQENLGTAAAINNGIRKTIGDIQKFNPESCKERT